MIYKQKNRASVRVHFLKLADTRNEGTSAYRDAP